MPAFSPLFGKAPESGRVLAWFSCGDASAVAAKLAVEKYGDAVIGVNCALPNDEHPTNTLFREDLERWVGKKVVTIRGELFWNILPKQMIFLIGKII